MQADSPDKIRNLAVVGHNDTGKTTLVSALLYTSGITTRLNKVEDGNTTTDSDSEEIARSISIGLSTAFAPWRQNKLNLLDCPGYSIFLSEIQSGMRAADTVLICVNAASGIEVTTEKLWHTAEEMGLPVMFHLTKMDRERADLETATAALRRRFGRGVMPIQIAIGKEGALEGVVDLVHERAIRFQKDGNGKGSTDSVPEELAESVEKWRSELIEAVAESDDELLEKFFEAGTLSATELVAGLKKAIVGRQIFPLTLSSALHGIGNSALPDASADLLPSPADRAPFPATNIGGDDAPVTADPNSETSTLVFKTINDPFTGRISLLRVVGGTLRSDSSLWNTRVEESERVGSLLLLQGKHGTATPAAVCGDIVGVAKLKVTNTGDTLCSKAKPVKIGWIEVAPPAMSFAVEPKSKGDDEKIGEAVHRLLDEDIGLSAGRDQQTGEYLLSGAGQLHVEIAVAKLKSRFKVDVILHPPKVPYREAIRRSAEGHGRNKKQSGGRGQFADCRITIEPLPRGEQFEFVDEIFGGSIPQNYRPAVDKGIQEAAANGFSTGFPVVDFRVRLRDGQHHEVDSSELAFKIAGSLAFKDAMAKASPVLLEPMMRVEITTGEQFMGDIMSDLSQRRGRPEGMDSRDDHTNLIKAVVPMAEMLDYASALTSMTQGTGSFTMAYSHYDPLPKLIQEKVVAEYRRDKEEAASH